MTREAREAGILFIEEPQIPAVSRASKLLMKAIGGPYGTRNPRSLPNVRRWDEIFVVHVPGEFESILRLIESGAMGHAIFVEKGIGKTSHMLAKLQEFRSRK